VFLGRHDRQLDDKGRLVLPAEYVRQLGEPESGRGVVFAPGRGGCLNVFTKQDFEHRHLEIGAAFSSDIPDEFFQHCQEKDVDKAGRVLIDAMARELAGIPDPAEGGPVQVIVAGSGRYLQIWHKDRYGAKARPASQFAEAVRP
jgi:DNA-binding transcriptional regulator/RsmH inhibitor MraZ